MARLKHPLAKAVAQAMRTPGNFHAKVRMVASHLLRHTDDEEAVIECLYAAASKVKRRRMSRSEITNVVRWLKEGPGRSVPGERKARAPKERPVDPAFVAEVDAIGWSVEKMRAKSEPVPESPSEVLASLYKDDPWLCVGWRVHEFTSRRLSEWQSMDLSGYERVCPNPFREPFLTKEDGSTSFKCNELVHYRKYLIIEFDEGTHDQQATRLGWLGKRFPMVMVVDSGNTSLHGWFRADHASLTRQRLFFEVALSLGADRAMWTISQFSRLPAGTNAATGRKQEVVFLHTPNAFVI